MYKVSKTAHALILFFFVTTAAKIVGMDKKYTFSVSQEQLKNMVSKETSDTFIKYFNPCLTSVFAKYYKNEKIKSTKAKIEKLKKEQASYYTLASWIYGSTLYIANDIFTYGGCQRIVPLVMAMGGVSDETALTAGMIVCQKLNGALFGGPVQGRNAKLSQLKNKIAKYEEEIKNSVEIKEEK